MLCCVNSLLPKTCVLFLVVRALLCHCQQFTEIAYADVQQQIVRAMPVTHNLPFTHGIVGLISYDDFASVQSPLRSRFFQVDAALIFDLHAAAVYQSGELETTLPKLPATVPRPSRRLHLHALENETDYLANVQRIVLTSKTATTISLPIYVFSVHTLRS